MTDTPIQTIEALDSLLDEERTALVSGDLEALDALMSRKSDLIEALRLEAMDLPDEIEPLQLKLRRNRELFEEALAGLRSVADRLQELREVEEGGGTYDGTGQRHALETRARGRLEKRA
ncbi:FlgN protein [Roseivivax jejudonensis]|uniref:FlgN protein n=1 Tax=Roseivivax jejudonensis TaxID=1529041 RepID=A0A1X6YGU5_9RHOB|nr:flagellar export chaperone FlgN [Roseivivax jejudonensis]SLN21118.1 FlgN protein [Roseivivax jejudonensis]